MSGGGADSSEHSLQLAPLPWSCLCHLDSGDPRAGMTASPPGTLGKLQGGQFRCYGMGECGGACPACWNRAGSLAGDGAADGGAQQDPHAHSQLQVCLCTPPVSHCSLPSQHNYADITPNSVKNLSTKPHLLSRFGLFDPEFPSSRVVVLGNFLGADGRVACLHQGFVPIQFTPEGSAAHGLGCLEERPHNRRDTIYKNM